MPEITPTGNCDAVRRVQAVPRIPRKKGLDDNDSWLEDDIFEDSTAADPPRRAADSLGRSD